jgi:hypothetical protein
MPQKNADFFNIAGETCSHAYSSVLLSYQLITSFFLVRVKEERPIKSPPFLCVHASWPIFKELLMKVMPLGAVILSS